MERPTGASDFGANGDGVAGPKDADAGTVLSGDGGATGRAGAQTPDDSFASPTFANPHAWHHANPFAQDGYQFANTSRGVVRIPPKRQRSESFLGPDDDVQPTRAFGASPKRALSELMANNLQKLNVSPVAMSVSPDDRGGFRFPWQGTRSPRVSDGAASPSHTLPFGGTAAATMDTSMSAMSTGRSESDKDGDDKDGDDKDGDDGESVERRNFYLKNRDWVPTERRVPTTPTERVFGSFHSATGDETARGAAWAPASEKLAAPDSLLLRRRSALSQQLAKPLPPLNTLNTFVAPSFVLPADVSMVLPSSPSADPSPRTDLRKQAIMKRVSLLHSTPSREPNSRDAPTSPTAAFHPRFFLPAAEKEDEKAGHDDEDHLGHFAME